MVVIHNMNAPNELDTLKKNGSNIKFYVIYILYREKNHQCNLKYYCKGIKLSMTNQVKITCQRLKVIFI